MRDSVTGKLMRSSPYGDDCASCDVGKTPRLITVTLSEAVLCTDICYSAGGGSHKIVNLPDLEGVYLLEQGLDYLGECAWGYADIGSFGTLQIWSSIHCPGDPTIEYEMTNLRFNVQVGAEGVFSVTFEVNDGNYHEIKLIGCDSGGVWTESFTRDYDCVGLNEVTRVPEHCLCGHQNGWGGFKIKVEEGDET